MPVVNSKKIKITKNGPYLVSGKLPLAKEIIELGPDNEPAEYGAGGKYPEQENYALCRCGRSDNKPYCDGTHIATNFDGTETASRKKYSEQAEKISGPDLDLTDAMELCASLRFCHSGGTTWQLVEQSDDPAAKKLAIKESCHCAAGRLTAWEKNAKQAIEPDLEQSLSLIEDPQAGVSGPIWVKGGVPIEADDSTQLEIRNRVTLCRCGQSNNKPYCDGAHRGCNFNDGDESLK